MRILILLTGVVTLMMGNAYAQNTSGKVYAGDKRVPGVLVQNLTQNKSTTTTDEGDFSLAARLEDSLVFSAPFMETQVFVVEQYQLEKVWVVELKENLNELDEVRLTEAPKEKPFDVRVYDSIFNSRIQNDIKKNRQLYRPPNSTNGVDFMEIGRLFMSLFKKDPSKQKESYAPITYKQYRVLFATDDYFNREFLVEQLGIDAYYHNLFFEYCDAMQLPGNLLEPENQLDLLDKFIALADSFETELNKFGENGMKLPDGN